jgi:hypothetical protein
MIVLHLIIRTASVITPYIPISYGITKDGITKAKLLKKNLKKQKDIIYKKVKIKAL